VKQPRFEVYQSDRNNQWYWRFIAANGEVVMQSEGYKRRDKAYHAINLVKEVSRHAEIIERHG
jgi:uncharacterized protein YegP (UPF0339 family)